METALPAPQTICQRCGNFATLMPVGGQDLCDECLARLQAEEITAGGLLGESLSLVRRVGLPGAAVLLLAQLPPLLFGAVFTLPLFFESLWGSTVGICAAGAVLLVAVRARRGEDASMGSAFPEAARSFVSLFASYLVANLVIGFFMLLLIVPGVLRAMSLAVLIPIVLFEGRTTFDAMRASTERMRGVRAAAFGAYLVSMLPIMLIVMGGGVFIAAAAGPGVNEKATQVFVGATVTVGMVFVHCVTAVLYDKTRFRGGAWF